jgi:imidazolonepropionase
MKIFIKNIKSLLMTIPGDVPFVEGHFMCELNQLNDAWLAIEDGIIADYGSMNDFDGIEDWRNLTIIDASGRFVLPAWCDSHTHTVFAKSRAGEFEDRLRGLTYEEIAKRGGGILNSAKNLQAMSEDDLYIQAFERLNFMMQHGTGAVEIKSGYGLTAESELKMLRVIKRLKESHPITIQSTFLALHAIPETYSGDVDAFVDHMIQDVLPIVASEKLADFVDVFCEKGYF